MNTKRYHPAVVTLHWLTVILLFASALLSKQKDMDGLPLNFHMILGFLLAFVMLIRVCTRFATKNPTAMNPMARMMYLALYSFTFITLGIGAWIAYRRNLLGYLIDPVSAVGRGGFKLPADLHKLSWQIALGWVILHVVMIAYRQILHKDDLLSRMWFGK